MKEFLITALSDLKNGYGLCGIVDRQGRVYPIGSDTKVISKFFEIVVRQAILNYVNKEGLQLIEPRQQNYYPDFTIMRNTNDYNKIAIDVKTTYLNQGKTRFGYTLGGYTSYIKVENESKNIVYPYSQYRQHWVIGFVYRRVVENTTDVAKVYSITDVNKIPSPLNNVEFFMQEKWRIAGDKAGSGNTTNIGSIRGTIKDFQQGNGPFVSEKEFIEYWREYRKTSRERLKSYSDIFEFRTKKYK